MTDGSALFAELRRRIAAAGPMPVAEYMAVCLADPQHGYYTTRDPLGAAGDFVTSPEISQMFGELLGVWVMAVWRQIGSPANVRLIELGPGRGTLMKDMLRAVQVMPDFIAATVVHLVELSPALRSVQEQTLAGAPVQVLWHTAFEDVPEGPSIIVANEFFDALPVHQAVKQDGGGWHERVVALDPDLNDFVFDVAPQPLPGFARTLPEHVRNAPAGSIFEWRSDNVGLEIGRRLARTPGAALVIDYGHTQTDIGDTLQAVGRHAFADPLDNPGTIDLTAHVDFEALAQTADSMGARAYAAISQAELLSRLGIHARAAVLRANASRAKAAEIDAAVSRLCGVGRSGMGELFKAIAVAHPPIGVPPGFER